MPEQTWQNGIEDYWRKDNCFLKRVKAMVIRTLQKFRPHNTRTIFRQAAQK
jgi:hypothetical protein